MSTTTLPFVALHESSSERRRRRRSKSAPTERPTPLEVVAAVEAKSPAAPALATTCWAAAHALRNPPDKSNIYAKDEDAFARRFRQINLRADSEPDVPLDLDDLRLCPKWRHSRLTRGLGQYSARDAKVPGVNYARNYASKLRASIMPVRLVVW